MYLNIITLLSFPQWQSAEGREDTTAAASAISLSAEEDLFHAVLSQV